MKNPTRAHWLQASVLGASLVLASCGGGGDSSPTAGNGGGSGGQETPGGGSPGGGSPGGNPGGGNPVGNPDGGNPGGGNTGGELTPPTETVFKASASDLPPVEMDKTYVYDKQPSLLDIKVKYLPTKVSGRGWYLEAAGKCTLLDSPPPTYPDGFVTLDTVDLDISKTDNCEPEIKVEVSVNGDKFYPAGMRLRGSSTREASQKSYRIKFTDEGQGKWLGEKTLQLNKHAWDLSRIRNKLSFDLMATVQHHPSLGTQFFKLEYDSGSGAPRSLGLFTHVEKMGSGNYFKRRAGWNNKSNVYKVEEFDLGESWPSEFSVVNLADGKIAPADIATFEKVLSIENDSGDHRAIVNLTKAIYDVDEVGADFQALFDHHFNKNNYLAWLSSVILLGNYDTQGHNYGLYQPAGTERFYYLPWDYDEALGKIDQPGESPYQSWKTGLGNWWEVKIHRAFMRQPGNIELLKKAVYEVRAKYLTDAVLKRLRDSYHDVIKPVILTQPDIDYLDTWGDDSEEVQWEREYARLQGTIAKNYASFLASLERPMPFWVDGWKGSSVIDWGGPEPFHPMGRKITYTLEIAPVIASGDPFAAGLPVLKKSGLTDTKFTFNPPSPGQYLVRVVAIDSAGNETQAIAEYEQANGVLLPGVKCMKLPVPTTGGEC